MGGPFFVVSRVHEIPFTCNTDDDDDGMRHSGKPDLDRSIFYIFSRATKVWKWKWSEISFREMATCRSSNKLPRFLLKIFF